MAEDTHDNRSAEPYRLLDNRQNIVGDDMRATIRRGDKMSIIAGAFSIYAYQALKKQLEGLDEFRFIFTNEAFTKEKAPREAREFYIPRLNRERALYGSEFELKLRNELKQQAVAKECADWIRRKAHFRANVSSARLNPYVTIEGRNDSIAYNPVPNFTLDSLGDVSGGSINTATARTTAPYSCQLVDDFNSLWNNDSLLQDVTDTVLENITAAYEEKSPEFIYFVALYNIFNEFLNELNEDTLPNEAVGFKNSKIWQTLYSFQKDAVYGCITKLDQYGGCILADSVGLGKTYTALGVIEYYQKRNKRVLVLCPKRLSENWKMYKANAINNPLADDRLNYDVLYHTDIDRDKGYTGDINLATLNWGNYELAVIDESHNFRNGESTTHRSGDEEYRNRYQKLIDKIIKNGVETRVLMLSATPVNTNFKDLENQLKIATGGNTAKISERLGLDEPVDKIFRDANAAFRDWSNLPKNERTTDRLLGSLKFDFFDLLDRVTIARSRKHIEQYYSSDEIGTFPKRRAPINKSPSLTDISEIDYDMIFQYIDRLNLKIYTPLEMVYPSALGKYVDISKGASWKSREGGRNVLMRTNLLKRLESSVYAFRVTVQRLRDNINNTINQIDSFDFGTGRDIDVDGIMQDVRDVDDDDDDKSLFVGKELQISLKDMDRTTWRRELAADRDVLDELLDYVNLVTPEHDLKLETLQETIEQKVAHPFDAGNRKVIVFTAFADTAQYLYDNLAPLMKESYGINTAIITGGGDSSTNCPGVNKTDFNDLLTCFSPISKNRDAFGDELARKDIDLLIATDCISEGQNLQDCDYLINYDIHWNPVRIIQRFGRIDRIGSHNSEIQLVNFWPDMTLDKYIDLKERVENRSKLVSITGSGTDVLEQQDPELEYRKEQLEKLQKEVVDLEDMNSGVSIMDLGLNDFHQDLQALLKKYGDADATPHGICAVAQSDNNAPPGVIYVLRNVNEGVNIDQQNRLHPYYLVYVRDNGEIFVNHLDPKRLLDEMRHLCKGNDVPNKDLVDAFNGETRGCKDMAKYSALLSEAIHSIINVKSEKDVDSLFTDGPSTFGKNDVNGLDDFELIDFLVIK